MTKPTRIILDESSVAVDYIEYKANESGYYNVRFGRTYKANGNSVGSSWMRTKTVRKSFEAIESLIQEEDKNDSSVIGGYCGMAPQ